MSAKPQLAAPSLPAEEIASTDQILGSNNETSESSRQREIARLAYRLWQQLGCPEGSAETDWQQAEQQLSRSLRAQVEHT